MGMWAKGKSGNPKGRPKAENSIAGLIRTKTKGGEYLVKRAMELSKSADENVAMKAIAWMGEFAFVKPALQVGLDEETKVSLGNLVLLARKERGLE